jgi:hypothetical protein
MVLPPLDFESSASANSATRARKGLKANNSIASHFCQTITIFLGDILSTGEILSPWVFCQLTIRFLNGNIDNLVIS